MQQTNSNKSQIHKMKIAILTCAKYPNLTPHEVPLIDALFKHQIQFQPLVWNEIQQIDEQFDLYLFRNTWDYFQNLDGFKNFLRLFENQPWQLINPMPSILWNMHKSYLSDLQTEGIPVVPSVFMNDIMPIEIEIRAEQLGWDEVILKPCVSANSHLTIRIQTGDIGQSPEVKKLIEFGDFVMQPYLPRIETEGELSLIFWNNDFEIEYSHGVVKRPQSGDYRVQFDFGGKYQQIEQIPPQALKVAQSALRIASNDWVYARVDLLNWQTDQPLVGEIEMIEPDLYFHLFPEKVDRFISLLNPRIQYARMMNRHYLAIKSDQEFYTDETTGLNVFTELHHRRRGECCGNACRHCPFGHINVAHKNI